MRLINVPCEYAESLQVILDDDLGVAIRIDGIYTQRLHVSDAENLVKALTEILEPEQP